jgi:hypothetical protein
MSLVDLFESINQIYIETPKESEFLNEAINYYKKHILILEKSSNYQKISDTLKKLIICYKMVKNHSEWINASFDLLTNSKKLDILEEIANALFEVAWSIWESLARDNNTDFTYDTCFKYFNESIQLYTQLDNKKILGWIYTNLNFIYNLD